MLSSTLLDLGDRLFLPAIEPPAFRFASKNMTIGTTGIMTAEKVIRARKGSPIISSKSSGSAVITRDDSGSGGGLLL